jgi:hypothetical protein
MQESAYAQTPDKHLNWGFRLGLNALSTTSYETEYKGEPVPNDSYTNKNGYLVNAFVRFNIKRVFLQPELGWNYHRQGVSFTLPTDVENEFSSPIYADIASSVARGNFLVGYSIVNKYPFFFGAYAGSSFSDTYKTKYSIRLNDDFEDREFYLRTSGIVGFSVVIAKIYFDLRYEINLPDTDLDFNAIPGFPDNYKGVKLKKNENIISFSCGLLF